MGNGQTSSSSERQRDLFVGSAPAGRPSDDGLRRRDVRTLAEAKQYVHDNMREGVECPCCGQMARIYKRRFSSIMARSLIAFYRHSRENTGHFHALDVLLARMPSVHGSGDYAKLAHWGLIEPQGERRQDGAPKNGYFCLTEKGARFVTGQIRIPAHVYLFNDKRLDIVEEPEETTDIRAALGKDFDFSELMGDVAPAMPERSPVGAAPADGKAPKTEWI